jgi:hypothetical protein
VLLLMGEARALWSFATSTSGSGGIYDTGGKPLLFPRSSPFGND